MKGRVTIVSQIYYIVCPKRNLVLDVNMCWKKYLECAADGLGIAIGLEIADALNIVAWVSYDGISAALYPEATAGSLFKKIIGEEGFLKKKVILHTEFIEAVSQGTYPDFLLRKPANKAEKKLFLARPRLKNDNTPKRRIFFRHTALISLAIHKVLLRQIALSGEKSLAFGHIAIYQTRPNCRKKSSNKDFFFDTSVTSFTNKYQRDDSLYSKGSENMYYIVNAKRNLFLSRSLTWIDIGSIKKNKKLMSQLLCVRDDIMAAQTISLWITPPGEATSPHTPSTLKRKYHLTFPSTSSSSLSDGIRSHKYPAFLLRRPENRREIVAFQMALRSGTKSIEERTLLSLGKLTESHSILETVNEATIVQDCGQEDKNKNIDNLHLEKSLLSEENDSFSFQHHVSSVMESSELIRSIVETLLPLKD